MENKEMEKTRVLHALFIGGMLLLVWAMMILLFADKQRFHDNRQNACTSVTVKHQLA